MELYQKLPLNLQVKIVTEYFAEFEYVNGELNLKFEYLYSKIPKIVFNFQEHYEYDEYRRISNLYLTTKRRYYLELNIPETPKYYYLEYLEETYYAENEVTEEIVEENGVLVVNEHYEWRPPNNCHTKTAFYDRKCEKNGYILTVNDIKPIVMYESYESYESY